MAGEVTFRLNTSAKDTKWMRGGVLKEGMALNAQDVRAIVERNMQPGLASLRQNVSRIGVRTGRLRRAPAVLTRKYGREAKFRILGLLGYRSGVAPHAIHIERGTPPRAGRGKVAAQWPAWLAFFANRQQMKSAIQADLEALVAKTASELG
jgi:hypothetical protein